MGDATIQLGPREQRRAYVLNQVLAGHLTGREAAQVLGLSERQLKRLKAGYQRDGPVALVHGNRGRVPWQAVPPAVRAQVVALAEGPYAGLNQVHLTEKLAEQGLVLDRSTVRRLLLAAGRPSPRPRRAPAHRSRRERMPREGVLLQGDGSRHRWLGPDQPYLTLIGLIDDATGTIPAAVFRPQEDAAGYLWVLRATAQTYGLPVALYVDRHGIFRKSRREPLTVQEELAGGALPTQVGRALDELGIQLILAQSPQAKGRIERLWGTLQDRLVAELRLAHVATLEAANAFLATFLPTFNHRFGVPAGDPGPGYRPLPAGVDLDQVCCFKYERTVRLDNTVVFGTQVLQLAAGHGRTSWARVHVAVHERLDGSVGVYHGEHRLTTTPAPPDPPTLRARGLPRSQPHPLPPDQPPSPSPALPAPRPTPEPPSPAAPRTKPRPDHPWRRSILPQHPPLSD